MHMAGVVSLCMLQERVCRKGDALQGPRVGAACLTLRNVPEGKRVDKARDFIGKWPPDEEQQGKGTQNCSAMWLTVLGFMVMELVSGLSLANHSDSGSFLVACALFSQDGLQREGFWEVGRTYELVSHYF